jgi:DNA polymerase-3 subunit delta'
MHPDIHYSYPTITRAGIEKPVCTDYIQEWRNFNQENPFGNVYDWLQSLDADNKQGNITAHECEDIIHKLNLKSFESGYKILIQWMPEYLGTAGNKLLKLIEEPPAKTLFILVAEDESKILPTILSRTQLIKINRVATNDVQSWLIETKQVPREKANSIAPLAQGNLREAIQMLHHGEENWQVLLREWLNAILKNGPAAQVKWVDEISKIGREKQKQFIAYLIHLLSISIRISNNEIPHDIAENEIDFSQRLLKLADTPQIQSMVEELDRSIYYIERNANPKMLFMALSIKFYHIIKDKMVILIN